jgi:ketosteroid isomerase-like protein
MTGRHIHDLPGMPATGRTFSVPGSSIADVRDGKITRNRDFWNNHDLLKQLGIL